MQSLILTLHLIVCFLLVILILLQSGKEGMGVIFGGGNSSVFGSSGAGGILAKLTAFMAVIFVITSLSYTYVTSSKPQTESAILNVKIEEPPAAQTPDAAPAPATPEAPKPDAANTSGAAGPAAPVPAPDAQAPAAAAGTSTGSATPPAGPAPTPAPPTDAPASR